MDFPFNKEILFSIYASNVVGRGGATESSILTNPSTIEKRPMFTIIEHIIFNWVIINVKLSNDVKYLSK